MMEIIEVIGIIVAIIGSLAAIITALLTHERRHTKVEETVKNMEKKVEKIVEKVDNMENKIEYLRGTLFGIVESSQQLSLVIETVKQIHPQEEKGNPYSQKEKEELLERYKKGTLDLEGAKRLQEILKEDMGLAQAENNVVAAIAIGLLLIGLGALIGYLLTRKE